MKRRAYLDIETTGLSRKNCTITVIGIAIASGDDIEVLQLIEDNINEENLMKSLYNVDELYTYNGSRFDLPFISTSLKIDLQKNFKHTDLMYACWKNKLKGGLKAVERKLRIERRLKDIDGYMAVKLWWDYRNNNNRDSLNSLLEYNREDIINLHTLRKLLNVE